MIFEHIEKLKKQYTDKYVVVDEGRPELKRFRGLTGTVKMKFGLRGQPDSDGNSVVDVYVSPRDPAASSTLNADESARHLQFLESMVPAGLMGYQFILKLIPEGVEDIRLEVLDTIAPVTY